MEAPDLSPPVLPTTVPTVANLLEGVNLPGISLDEATAATAELLTAASVDDPVGVVELRTLVTTHPAFEAAAQVTVLASRYRPARLRGRVVRQLVRQTLRFRAER